MVRRLTLDQFIEVQILAGQPKIIVMNTATYRNNVSGFLFAQIAIGYLWATFIRTGEGI